MAIHDITRNSNLRAKNRMEFDERFVAIAEDGARRLIDRHVRLVGIEGAAARAILIE